jgi:hypothetical protein
LKRILADKNVPRPLVRLLKAFDIKAAAEPGWDTLRNGKLMEAAERDGFEVLLTGDQTIADENATTGRKIGLVLMSDNHWPIVRAAGLAGPRAGGRRSPPQIQAWSSAASVLWRVPSSKGDTALSAAVGGPLNLRSLTQWGTSDIQPPKMRVFHKGHF